MPKTVGVAVSNATFHFDKLYTYAVMPDQQGGRHASAAWCWCPFGRGARRIGVVLACEKSREHAKLQEYLFDVAPASRLPDAGAAAASCISSRSAPSAPTTRPSRRLSP